MDGPAVGSGNSDVEWSVLDTLAAQQHSRDQLRQQQRRQELQQRLRQDLDKQMQDSRLKKEREREQEQEFHKLQARDAAAWREQEQAREAARHQRVQAERSEQTAQIASDRAKRAKERLREQTEAQGLLEGAGRDLAEDQRRAEERWVLCRAQAQRALEAGSQSLRLREEAQRLEAEREAKSVEAYEGLRARREQRAVAERDKECGRRQALEVQAAERVAAVHREEAAAAAGAAAQLAEQNRAAAERDREALGQLAEKRQLTQAYLRQQMQQKQDAKMTEQERQRQHRLLQEGDAVRFREDERTRAAHRRLQHLEHRTELERQMAGRMAPPGPCREVMTASEVRLNRGALARAICDVA